MTVISASNRAALIVTMARAICQPWGFGYDRSSESIRSGYRAAAERALAALAAEGYAVVQLPAPSGVGNSGAYWHVKGHHKGVATVVASTYHDGSPRVDLDICEDGLHFEADLSPSIAAAILAAHPVADHWAARHLDAIADTVTDRAMAEPDRRPERS